MSRAARTARTPSSPTTAAATGIAPSVRAPPPSNGSPSARPSCCPSAYFHVVFTLPGPIADIAYQNKAVIYDLLFKAAAETTLTIAADPKHLGARIGITAVLHTWGSAMTHHPHLHMIVPGGGISARRTALGVVPARFLPPGARALAPVPPAVPQDARRRAQGRPPRLLRRPRRTRRHQSIRRLPRTAAQGRVGGLCQEAVRRTAGRARLSLALHPPRRHLQQPADLSRPDTASPSSGRITGSKDLPATRS